MTCTASTRSGTQVSEVVRAGRASLTTLAALQGQAVSSTTHTLMHEIIEELEGHAEY